MTPNPLCWKPTEGLIKKIGFKPITRGGPCCNVCSGYKNKACQRLKIIVKGNSLCEKWFESKYGKRDLLSQKLRNKGRNKKRAITEGFYTSREWRALRLNVLIKQDRKCCVCGRSPKDGIILHVDHIKPRSKYPELELHKGNLQVLCADCNLGKSNRYEEDWR